MNEIGEEEFHEYFADFHWNSENSGSVLPVTELLPKGNSRRLKYEELKDFVKSCIDFRLNEATKQEKEIRTGLSWVLPVALLKIMTWEETQGLFCGQGDVDVSVLQSHTIYEGVRPNAEYIQYFWTVLTEMSPLDRKRFLKFVSSRSRLPSSPHDWTMPFKIQCPTLEMKDHPDQSFPHAQTCFFSLTLPEYSSLEVMKRALLRAIECVEMDADERVDDRSAWGTPS